MLKRYNRLLVALHIGADVLSGILAFALAYWVRFETVVTTLAPITKGHPPFRQYLSLLPFIGLLIPAAFHLQGLYRLRRGRTRVDDFFADAFLDDPFDFDPLYFGISPREAAGMRKVRRRELSRVAFNQGDAGRSAGPG